HRAFFGRGVRTVWQGAWRARQPQSGGLPVLCLRQGAWRPAPVQGPRSFADRYRPRLNGPPRLGPLDEHDGRLSKRPRRPYVREVIALGGGGRGGSAMPMKNISKQTRFHIGYWIAAILGLLALQYFYTTAQKVAAIPYSQFEQLLRDHKVAEVGISDRYI